MIHEIITAYSTLLVALVAFVSYFLPVYLRWRKGPILELEVGPREWVRKRRVGLAFVGEKVGVGVYNRRRSPSRIIFRTIYDRPKHRRRIERKNVRIDKYNSHRNPSTGTWISIKQYSPPSGDASKAYALSEDRVWHSLSKGKGALTWEGFGVSKRIAISNEPPGIAYLPLISGGLFFSVTCPSNVHSGARHGFHFFEVHCGSDQVKPPIAKYVALEINKNQEVVTIGIGDSPYEALNDALDNIRKSMRKNKNGIHHWFTTESDDEKRHF